MIRVVIADDEPLARDEMRRCVARTPGLELVAEARDGIEAVDAVLTECPDLLLLDVQMPGCDGFEVVTRIRGHHLPIVVFVTAYDRYALDAFEAHALDYLLKPFNEERFGLAIAKVRRMLAQPTDPERAALTALLQEVRPVTAVPAPLERLSIPDRGGWKLVRVLDVDWFESAGNYVEVHAGDAVHLIRMTLATLEESLDPQRFARIHRTTIVNLDRVAEVHPGVGETFEVKLHDGRSLRMSPRFRRRVVR